MIRDGVQEWHAVVSYDGKEEEKKKKKRRNDIA